MDNQNINNTNTPPLINPNPQPVLNPTAPQPSGFLSRIKGRKKLLLTIIAIIFLLGVLIFYGISVLKNNFFSRMGALPPSSIPASEVSLPSSMQIKTAKTSFTLSEKIPVSVVGNSSGNAITAFDAVIEYDPQFLTISEKKKPPLGDFIYYGKNTNTLISVSGVQKAESNTLLKLDNTTLFELEFTPKKAGKTVLKIIYMPGSAGESNLIDSSSRDILSQTTGVEMTIN